MFQTTNQVSQILPKLAARGPLKDPVELEQMNHQTPEHAMFIPRSPCAAIPPKMWTFLTRNKPLKYGGFLKWGTPKMHGVGGIPICGNPHICIHKFHKARIHKV